jgi:hypothetical protein
MALTLVYWEQMARYSDREIDPGDASRQ